MTDKSEFLRGKTAIITGAAGGIGEAICHELAKHHINMLLIGRNLSKLDALAEALKADDLKVLCLAGDLRNIEFIDQIVQTAVEYFGGIDILINNAGLAHHCSMEDMTLELYNEIMETNVRAPYFLCKNALKYLRNSECATIINMCSASSHKGYQEQSVYVASKHALLGMSKTLAAEVYRQNIRVHTISPGSVYTSMIALVRPDLTDDGMIMPSDIANIIAFLLENRKSNAVVDEIRLNRCTKEPFS